MREGNRNNVKIVAGIDLGSITTKSLILDHNKKILSYNILRTGASYKNNAETSISEALQDAGLELKDLAYIVSTGYGRERAAFSNEEITEISCHARGAKEIFPHVHTVIDIGGQDSKVIHVDDNGRPVNFVMNDKCAAGTGRFLEIAASALEVDVGEMGAVSLRSKKEVSISSTCAVFAESEIISLRAKGCDKEDILAGIHDAIARRIAGLVGRIGIREEIVMSGGVAKNIGAVKALEDVFGVSLHIPPESQITGALGAAILASERVKSKHRIQPVKKPVQLLLPS
jgi:predicted CoA-substrate-specific enzyme activase